MPSINPRQVEAFRAVMITGGMTPAAELIGISQPAVSRLIRDFEATLKLALFERRGNQISPTADAIALMAEVDRSFLGLSRISELATALRSEVAGSLRLAALPALAAGVLPRFVSKFLAQRPQVRASIQGMSSHMVIEAVAAGQADVGYAVGSWDRPGFTFTGLPSPAVVVLPKAHRLAARLVIEAKDLADERLIGIAAGTLFRSRIDAALADVTRTIVVETPWTQSACLMVEEGLGIGIVDVFSAAEFHDRDLVARRFVPEIDTGLLELHTRHRALTTLAETFSKEFRAHLAQVSTKALPA
jgi:DNA-binding transcriptional LysR family regulator